MAIFSRLLDVFGDHGTGNDVCICLDCGSLFLNNVLSDILKMKFNTVDSSFTSAQVCVRHKMTDDDKLPIQFNKEIFLTNNQRVVKLKRFCHTYLGENFVDEPMNILDIGSRGGALSLPLNRNDSSNFTLIESDIAFRPAIATNANIELYSGLLDDFVTDPKRANKYDIIIALHVLEHVVYPQKFLENISSLLSDQGIAIIEVPYERGCALNTSKGRYYQWNHNHLFNPESLRTLLDIVDCFDLLHLELEPDGYIPGLDHHCQVITAVVQKNVKSKGSLISDDRIRLAKGLDELTQTFAGSAVCFGENDFSFFIHEKSCMFISNAFLGMPNLKEIITDNRELAGQRIGDRSIRLENISSDDLFGVNEIHIIVFTNPDDAAYFRAHCSSKLVII